ncbi:cupin domain-containing protein [Ruegeria sp. PrR005]|uniref:Cupin domain-containing protein n=1 Tax=Ruegeria sp. PrR005 TaxID=2706882 RepID=A0A6B2NLJ3_9RHOB|nr:cupin domain-containing protein [Ruegeria sp. PrR005]NDW44972.1 cupin domain-containing protein [Ruegeria sp. PrR005]
MDLIDHDSQACLDWRPGVSTRMRVSALTGASALSIFEQWCEPGLGAPTHWHPVEEVLTVLSGEAEIWFEGERLQARAGHSALIPATRRHGFRNVGDGQLHMLAILASPIFEAHFDDSQDIIRRWIPGPERS